MKKAILIVSCIMLLSSCRNDKKPVPPPEAPMTETTSDVTGATAVTDSITEDPDGTSVKIGPEGINVKTGKGNKKTNVDIKASSGAKINIKP